MSLWEWPEVQELLRPLGTTLAWISNAGFQQPVLLDCPSNRRDGGASMLTTPDRERRIDPAAQREAAHWAGTTSARSTL